ncbi:MAG: SIS domain-containing protein [Anaerolineaceae bacterium]|nr:SIS domain-containing protein [Anaerolineaceae bacterium]
MVERGSYTRAEIFSQPERWAQTLAQLKNQASEIKALLDEEQFQSVLFTGCGSTYYLAQAAAAICQQLVQIPARGLPASEIWLYPDSAYLTSQKTLLVAVSRSGETTETLRAVAAFKAQGNGKVITLSCYPTMPLASVGDLNLVLDAGQEDSVAQTRAFSVLYLGTVFLAALWAGKSDLIEALEKLPDAGSRLLRDYAELAKELGSDLSIERFYLLGSGLRYGLAAEVSLKLKEMTLSHSEPFHFLEYRHGPMSMVTEHTLLFGLESEVNHAAEKLVLSEMQARGARVLSLGESDADVVFKSGVPEAVRNILYLPFGQLMAFERSMAKGLNPDRPNNLETVVRLDNSGQAQTA